MPPTATTWHLTGQLAVSHNNTNNNKRNWKKSFDLPHLILPDSWPPRHSYWQQTALWRAATLQVVLVFVLICIVYVWYCSVQSIYRRLNYCAALNCFGFCSSICCGSNILAGGNTIAPKQTTCEFFAVILKSHGQSVSCLHSSFTAGEAAVFV